MKKTEGGLTTVYHHDAAGRVIAETLPNGTKLRDYLYFGNRLLAVDGCMDAAASSGCSERQWYHTDSLGSPLARTDHSGGVVARFDYQPWGDVWSQSGVPGDRQYNGRVFDSSTGFHDYDARLYWPEIGRFISADRVMGQLQSPMSLNRYSYVYNNPYKYVDPTGQSGVLTIYSNGDGGSFMTSGHAWIAYTPDVAGGVGVTTTYGTWGNRPTGKGLYENLEKGRAFDSSRTMHIDDAAEADLMKVIADANAQKGGAWKYSKPCSGFAREAWKAATKEDLNSNYGPIDNPTTLKESIIEANGGVPNATAEQPNTASSASSGSAGRSSGSSSIDSSASSSSLP